MAKKKGNGTSTTKTAMTVESNPPSKMDAVRTALKEGAGKPEDGVAFIKKRFGLDVDVKMFSVYKSKINKEGGRAGKKRGRKPKTAMATAPVRAASPASVTVASPLDALKNLVRDFGKDGVKKLVDMV